MSPNPSPYINRANLLAKRLRYREALSDLLEAQRLDRRQANEFASVLDREIGRAKLVTHHYDDGLRENLLVDLKHKDPDAVAEKIFCASFNVPEFGWRVGLLGSERAIVEHHFFNEVDNIIKFDDLSVYPEVEEWRDLYDARFIDYKVRSCPDFVTYTIGEFNLHAFLCCYDEGDMRYLRRSMLYRLHNILLTMDFGIIFGFDSKSNGVIREAEEFNG